jgi:cell division protein ZapA
LERIALDAEILDEKADAKADRKRGRKAAGSSSKRARRPVTVQIGGQEYRIRSAASEAWLRKVAACVDEAMGQIRERTDTVDSLDVALLTALNLARQVIQLRESQLDGLGELSENERVAEAGRLRDLIERVEGALVEGAEVGRGKRSSRP